MVVVDNIIRVYDRNMKKLAYLENAYDIGYELTLNELWYASFTLPADDIKNQYCQPFNYVEIYDGRERIELFRIMPSTLTRNTKGDIVYQCEHVLATLLDDVLFKYHQIGNIGVYTTQVIRYILDQQTEKRWQLGICEFNRQFEYKWENENLLAALFSVPQPFDEGYRWEFDTTGTVWRLHLKKLPAKFKADIVYKKNMVEIQKEVDPTSIVTRLYCLGYGEGDNQLGIESVNNGLPYLQASGASTTWGIKSSILVDRRFENPETLKAYGQALLNELKNPYKSYSVKAVDLHRRDPNKYEKFFPGDIVRIIDKEDNIIEDLPIIKVSKSDITGSPGDIEIEIANKNRDVAGSISDLQSRTRINEVYAQGATNQMIVPFADNADPQNPAIMRVYIPDTMVRINKCILNYQLEAFRAYSKAIAGGGGTVASTSAGGATTQTSSSGGGGTTTSSSGGGCTTTSSSGGGGTTTSSSGGGGTTTSSSGGGTTSTTNMSNVQEVWDIGTAIGGHMMKPAGEPPHVHALDTHSHPHKHNVNIPNHRHDITLPNHRHDITLPNHRHDITIPNHRHDITIPDHRHDITIPNHQHNVTIPDHIHELEFGIYQGTTADKVTIKVDGKPIPQTQPGQDIDIVKYLSTDSAGKINRNTWHTIEIIPDRMTRIVANVFMQIFTNSRGGGDY